MKNSFALNRCLLLAASAAYARLSADRAWQKAFRRAHREMTRVHK